MNNDRKELEDKKTFAMDNYTGPFCCFELDNMINDNEPPYNIKYNPVKREYYLESLQWPYTCRLKFCPWCGYQFPKSLRDEWFDILEEEYGLDLPDIPEQKKKIPVDFLTDEWWKKRGL